MNRTLSLQRTRTVAEGSTLQELIARGGPRPGDHVLLYSTEEKIMEWSSYKGGVIIATADGTLHSDDGTFTYKVDKPQSWLVVPHPEKLILVVEKDDTFLLVTPEGEQPFFSSDEDTTWDVNHKGLIIQHQGSIFMVDFLSQERNTLCSKKDDKWTAAYDGILFSDGETISYSTAQGVEPIYKSEYTYFDFAFTNQVGIVIERDDSLILITKSGNENEWIEQKMYTGEWEGWLVGDEGIFVVHENDILYCTPGQKPVVIFSGQFEEYLFHPDGLLILSKGNIYLYFI